MRMIFSKILATLKSYIYIRVLSKLKTNSVVEVNIPENKDGEAGIATVCDVMTWENICQEHVAISLKPRGWQRVFDSEEHPKIKLFFCEATWSGTTNNCWRGQVYKDRRVFYENRRDLLRILKECNEKKIPTVFWAKEDPTYFQDDIYDFTDTALKFDYILTTAQECIPKYHGLGHKKVYLWPFGFSTKLYYPPKETDGMREEVAVFAGSWFVEHHKRCEELTDIFDMVLERGISLRIYDRNRKGGQSAKAFPPKYQQYVHDGIPYRELGEIYRGVEYVININTVQDSSTMFSRRVYEAMACGGIVITNESLGLRKQFGDRVWYLGQDFDFEQKVQIGKENIETVFKYHTWEQRMKELCTILRDD
jgi:spore maturation protein CgeB